MRVLDLFSGIGGFSLGLESTGFFKTVQFVENEKWCQKILRKNFPGVPIHDDIKTFKGYDADLVVGGFPCQPFSVAGKQKAIQDDRHLWPEMFRVIKETKPTWVIGENVRNIISISDGMVLEQVYLDLESENYEVQSFIIPASAVNAPHQRYRTWIVAHTECMGWEQRATQSEKFEGKATPNKFNYSSKRRIIGKAGEDVANTDSWRPWSKHSSTFNRKNEGIRFEHESGGSGESKTMAHTDSRSRETFDKERVLGKQNRKEQTERYSNGNLQVRGQWDFEPNVGRVANGIPNRVDRLRGLGNAIVPQIAYQIGMAIMSTYD